MEKNCEICGDIGFQKALITCYQFRSADVHLYCVMGYYEDAPVDWCCEECHIGKGVANEHRSSNAVNESRMVNSHPCDPALVHSWMGNVEIVTSLEIALGTINISCIQAHPPTRVRCKVYEFSKLLSDTLKLELVPRGDIWASLFNNHYQDKEDIGLYFIASDYEGERIEQRHFLWRLFYRMGQDTDGCAEGGSDKVIDMEIDMIAGENVGTLDIVVSTANRVDMECFQNEVDMEIEMIARENVGTLDIVVSTANKVDMEDYQNEVEMEIDMIAGENIGTLDIVVQKWLQYLLTPFVDEISK